MLHNCIRVKLSKIEDNRWLMDREIWVFWMKKTQHRFLINDEDVQYQYHDHESVPDHIEDQEVLQHNVIHLYPDCFSKNKNKSSIKENQNSLQANNQ